MDISRDEKKDGQHKSAAAIPAFREGRPLAIRVLTVNRRAAGRGWVTIRPFRLEPAAALLHGRCHASVLCLARPFVAPGLSGLLRWGAIGAASRTVRAGSADSSARAIPPCAAARAGGMAIPRRSAGRLALSGGRERIGRGLWRFTGRAGPCPALRPGQSAGQPVAGRNRRWQRAGGADQLWSDELARDPRRHAVAAPDGRPRRIRFGAGSDRVQPRQDRGGGCRRRHADRARLGRIVAGGGGLSLNRRCATGSGRRRDAQL